MEPKVLIISSYSGSGISVRPEVEMVTRLKQQGVNIDIMADTKGPYTEVFKAHGINVFHYKPVKKISLHEIRTIRKVLLDGGYDLVHVFNNKAVTNTLFASRNLPVKIITYRGYTGHLLWYKPTSYISHLNPKVRKITCVSNGSRDHVRKQLFFNPQKAVTIYKGHDPEWYQHIAPYPKKSLGFPEKSFLVGCVANARPMKGIPYLIKATNHLAAHPDIHFMLIGKNMDTPYHTRLMRQSPLQDNFHLMGFKKDVLKYLGACDALVLSSIRGEGLSKVIIEAMSTGIPVIATHIGGNPELVIHEQTGLLVPPGSSKSIAEAIISLKNNKAMAEKLAGNARNYIFRHFHIDHTVEQMKKLYESLI